MGSPTATRTVQPAPSRADGTAAQARQNRFRVLRRRLAVFAAVFLGMYGLITWRSAALHNAFIGLDTLQRQETQLLAKNAELKIEVDGLKGPEWITSIAEKQLGMSVARRNIYVKVK